MLMNFNTPFKFTFFCYAKISESWASKKGFDGVSVGRDTKKVIKLIMDPQKSIVHITNEWIIGKTGKRNNLANQNLY